MSPLEPADRVLTTLRELLLRARRVKAQEATAVHPALHGGPWTLLVRLIEDGPTRACTIAQRLEVPPSVVTRQADELAALGLLERRVDPTDGRARLLAATDDARHRCGDEPRPYGRLVRSALAGWEPRDVETLAGLLERLSRVLEPADEPVDVACP
ncbi:MarR family winged helix-turn-helix transcriptional regulator [Angustibacter luteus]|uniref:MarR family winged helix-turn-helix transcriptional regulator n=1 Tax=Angustibacter luteus TaxID=658456 RepID=A0ABW1JBN4_9ACTN